ncbi:MULTISPECIES: hypothetical protein [Amycolatopsis]|uniref:hypothetical protein n=1 Tax=Amycolatopsis TaxID=1813 RepID=UPI0007E2366C|nr:MULTISPECIES: hypothetical protein [Amycolatopsis]OAP26493.1 hypothetical protein A4R44_02480 [Amycolatopsis sp. M39]
MEPFLPAPQPVRWRRGVYAAALVVPFTVAQVWALLVLLSLGSLHGLVGQAFLVTLAGSVVATAIGWRWVWRLGSERKRVRAREEMRRRAYENMREFGRENLREPRIAART